MDFDDDFDSIAERADDLRKWRKEELRTKRAWDYADDGDA